jgi:hypothetical protein
VVWGSNTFQSSWPSPLCQRRVSGRVQFRSTKWSSQEFSNHLQSIWAIEIIYFRDGFYTNNRQGEKLPLRTTFRRYCSSVSNTSLLRPRSIWANSSIAGKHYNSQLHLANFSSPLRSLPQSTILSTSHWIDSTANSSHSSPLLQLEAQIFQNVVVGARYLSRVEKDLQEFYIADSWLRFLPIHYSKSRNAVPVSRLPLELDTICSGTLQDKSYEH